MTLEIVQNNKGRSKLCFEGYTNTKKSASKTTTHWECSQRKEYTCKDKVTADSQVARVLVEHSHDANLERVEATKIIAIFNLFQAYYNDDKTLIQTLKGIEHIIKWK